MTDKEIIERLAKLLREEATQLNRWSDEAISGGWSVQHVKAMRDRAGQIRLELDRIGLY